ncbi:GntR family transcriptional regulator [Salinisphaera sp. USBA-960]|nr:GntR family transcriptional regulator [Salifodinibacter halophilus]NNC25360.1 GntR family transcriptional regulator [Salifodinibacter halophilus]
MDAMQMLGDNEKQARAEHAHTGSWVAGILRSRIAEGQLTPGTRLSEQALANALGVSRNTLREAFTTLAGESIVTRIPNRGVFVASPDADEVREIYNVRRAIEPGAVLWGTLTDDALAHMQRIVDGALAARDRGDIPAMADANQDLHKAIIALTGSHTLEQLMARVLAEMRLVFHAMAAMPDFHSRYVERNIALVALLRDNRRLEAAHDLRDYLDLAESELLAHIAADAH